MLKKHIQGFSLIEIILFIIVLGIIGSSLLVGLNQSIHNSDVPRSMPQSSYLANARLQIIMMNRTISGYTTLADPCTTTPSLAICTPLVTYATAQGLTVATPTISGANPKTITVNVTGDVNVTATQQIYDYGNN
jgi:type II secretory pathway pseudopilin PulG